MVTSISLSTHQRHGLQAFYSPILIHGTAWPGLIFLLSFYLPSARLPDSPLKNQGHDPYFK
jgi:hypothetical protein